MRIQMYIGISERISLIKTLVLEWLLVATVMATITTVGYLVGYCAVRGLYELAMQVHAVRPF